MFQRYYSSGFGLTRAVSVLMLATIGVFVLQFFVSLFFPDFITIWFGVSVAGMRAGLLWQPITYMFLHATFLHILFNMIGLYFFGPDVERTIGTTRFVRLYLTCGVLGGIGWLLFSRNNNVPCIGASGAIFGLLGTFAALFPNRPITLLVFFVVPLTFRARTFAIMLGIFTLFMMMYPDREIAHAAHLLGGIAGYTYGRLWPRGGLPSFRFKPRTWWNNLLWHWHRRKFRVMPGSSQRTWRASDDAPDSEDVDAILEKVHKSGLGSLTRREREVLERASRQNNRSRPFGF